MGKYHGESMVLHRPSPICREESGGGGGQFKFWSASFRRIVLDTVRCGGRAKHNTMGGGDNGGQQPEPEQLPKARADLMTLRSELKKHAGSRRGGGSEKLSDLLKMSERSEQEQDEEVTKRKVEALEELKSVVKRLQACQDEKQGLVRVLEGARDVRRLTKDDCEARTTLALLGAIPPLVILLEAPDLTCQDQIAALYALLNLGIANDV